MMQGLMGQALWVEIWMGWMMVINLMPFLFLRHREARWTLAAFVASFISMNLLAEMNGFNRLLGIAHIIWWTPLVIYLFRRRKELDYATLFGRWVIVLLITNTASLVIDYVDVIRFVIGNRR